MTTTKKANRELIDVHLQLPPDLYNLVRAQAEREHRSVPKWIQLQLLHAFTEGETP